MPDFLNSLASAYRDPAMKPVGRTVEAEQGLSTPFLSSGGA